MAAFNPVNSLLRDILQGKHTFQSDSFVLALCASANAPVAANAVLGDLTQISYTNLSSRAFTVSAVEITETNKGRVVGSDVTLTASGGNVATFRYAVLYNDTEASDALIGWWDLGQDITILDGNSHVLNLDADNNVLLTLQPA